MPESIHARRAKEWLCTPFMAEWFENSVKYCRDDPAGKRHFEGWMIERYGPVEGKQMLSRAYKPAPRYPTSPIPSIDEEDKLKKPAFEFRITWDAMALYHTFTSDQRLVLPKQTKPAIKRRRGEGSIDWLIRRDSSLANGCKPPDMDWGMARATAISELDRTRDTMKIWRTDPGIFIQAVVERSKSYIPSDVALQYPPELLERQKLGDAFRGLQRGLILSHMTWSFALNIFDDFAQKGLTTSSSIERAYKQDKALMWRLASLFTKVILLHNYVLGRLSESLSWSEHFRPYFIRSRGNDGIPKIRPNMANIPTKGLSEIEDVVLSAGCQMHAVGLFKAVSAIFKKNPSEANKFSEEAFDALGDVAIVHEFLQESMHSPFAQKLQETVMAVDMAHSLKHPQFLSETTFLNPTKHIQAPNRERVIWGYTRIITDSISLTLVRIISTLSLFPLGHDSAKQMENISLMDFDKMWLTVDTTLWTLAEQLDKPGETGTVAKHFGLFDPTDPRRPTFAKSLFKYLNPAGPKQLQLESSPAVTQFSVPLPAEQNAAARIKSGHSYVVENQESSKEKVKTRKAPEFGQAQVTPRTLFEDEEDAVNFPDMLPTEYKLGKKVMKVFHRILDPANDGEEEGSDGLKKGQVRWTEFEKAMRRVGFAICQTTGSSVRFDPPAKSARPITFHRPHPDPVLTPRLIKIIGARLKRCYGWTMATFVQGAEKEE